jgi:hypothetical protein
MKGGNNSDTLQSSPNLSMETRLDIGQPFIRLPYTFDAERLADEISGIANSAWMQHPQRLTGNSAVALISRDGTDNDDFSGRMQETEHLQGCAYLRQVLASFDEVLGRSRLMKLTAGSEVALHVDFNYHWYSRVRIHIPIITSSQVTFYCADQTTNMGAGESWIFNAWRRHRVTNEGDQDRVHLVVDTAGSARFWNMLRNVIAGSQETRHVRYVAGDAKDIRTEQHNISAVMAPGEVDALVSDLISDFELNPINDAALVNSYRSLLFDFSKDWREIWLQYGDEKSAWPLYQSVIDKAHERMQPERRAIVTQSNDIGVNPIIVQRILRSALADQGDGKS